MHINGAQTSYILGKSDIFITEACEFKRSFLKLNPTVAVVTNIDADHLDCYRDIYEIRDAFREFTQKASHVITHDDADFAPKLSIPGRHNAENAALAVKVAKHFGISMPVIERALADFPGIDRRFQKIASPFGKTDLIVDFAHHPREIEVTINTAIELYGLGNFLIAFQPHTFTRTVALFGDFCRVLGKFDTVLYKTYSARETEITGGTAQDLATAMGAPYFETAAALRQYITENHAKYAAILLVGAGDIYKLFVDKS
jgi:UDP-N-acetylmuramate--alanine ligase